MVTVTEYRVRRVMSGNQPDDFPEVAHIALNHLRLEITYGKYRPTIRPAMGFSIVSEHRDVETEPRRRRQKAVRERVGGIKGCHIEPHRRNRGNRGSRHVRRADEGHRASLG